MLHRQFDASDQHHVTIYTEDELVDHGKMLVGSDGIVRIFTHQQIQDMNGLGHYSPHTGHAVYDDGR